MKKSPSDTQNYRFQKLSSGTKLLHVEDASSDYCAIALMLNTGSFSDPKDCQGLAHLMEHCLFTGSQNFPQDNSLTQYLDAHQGQLNGRTTGESTTFYFKVHHQFFDNALEMFFDMFLNPLFSLQGIEKELSAIDAEFQNNILEEKRRVLEVQKETSNSEHPFTFFTVGNNSVFGKFDLNTLQQKLRELWKQSFFASNINVSLITNSHCEKTVEYVEQQLLRFPNTTPDQKALPDLYLDDHLQRHIQIATQRFHSRLILIFSLTDNQLDYKQKSDALLSHLFGYEGPGSLLNFWKCKKWASQVVVGTGLSGSNFLDFNFYIELTENGRGHINELMHSILFFAELIKNSPRVSHHHNEKARLNQLAFLHKPKQSVLDTALELVQNMDIYPDDDIVIGEYMMDDYDHDALLSVLENVRPERSRAILISQASDTDQTTRWYNVPYSSNDWLLSPISKELQDEMAAALRLPQSNEYIPAFDNPLPDQDAVPELILKSNAKFWTGIDTLNSESKGECFFSWRKTSEFCGLENVAYRKLYCSALESKLNDKFYPAQLAGIHFNFYSHQTGVGLHTSGFAEKQLKLCENIIEVIYQDPVDCPDFEVHKQEYLNTLMSDIRNKPLNRLFTALQATCVAASWLPEDLGRIAVNANQSNIAHIHEYLFNHYQLEGLIYGYWPADDIEQFIENFSSRSQVTETTAQLDSQNLYNTPYRNLYFPCEHNDSALVVYLQSPEKNLQQQANMMLIEIMLAGFYFDWMRNQKQLGYQVGTGYMPFNEHPGIAMYIQSSTASPATLYAETRACMMHFHQWMRSLPAQHWMQYQHSLARQLKGKKISFEVKCQRFWSAIGRNPVDFLFEQHLQESVLNIEPDKLCDWFKTLFLDTNKDFSIYTAGNKAHNADDFECSLPSIYHFKSNIPG